MSAFTPYSPAWVALTGFYKALINYADSPLDCIMILPTTVSYHGGLKDNINDNSSDMQGLVQSEPELTHACI